MINDKEKAALLKGIFDTMPHSKKYEVIALPPEILCNLSKEKKRKLLGNAEIVLFIREFPC